jgi:hypothetical protein
MTVGLDLRIDARATASLAEREGFRPVVDAWNALADRVVALRDPNEPPIRWVEAVALLEGDAVAEFLANAKHRDALARVVFDGVVLDRWAPEADGAREWRPTVALCRAIARSTPHTEAISLVRACAARDVALRHTGASPSPAAVSPELLATLAAEDRYMVLAQWLQFAADGDLVVVEPRVSYALSLAGAGPGWLRLLGAIGRACAANGDFRGANEALDRAIDGWRALGEWGELSRPLCERVRLTAIADGPCARTDELLALARDAIARSEGPATFLRVALGRALVQLDRPDEAIVLLEANPADGGGLGYPETAALRWLALADESRAPALRARLEEDGSDDQWILARLDERVARLGAAGLLEPEGQRLVAMLVTSVVEATEHRLQLARITGAGAPDALRPEVLAAALPRYLRETRY